MDNRTTRPFDGTDKKMLWVGLSAACVWWILEAILHSLFFDGGTIAQQLITSDRHELWMRSLVFVLFIVFGAYAYGVVDRINQTHEEQRQLRQMLEDALTTALNGFLPICAGCKKIRLQEADPEAQTSWQQLETYLTQQTDVQFTHSICPACEHELYGDL